MLKHSGASFQTLPETFILNRTYTMLFSDISKKKKENLIKSKSEMCGGSVFSRLFDDLMSGWDDGNFVTAHFASFV